MSPVRCSFAAVLLGVCLYLIGPASQAAGVNYVEVQTDGAGNTVDGLAGVSGVAVSPDGNFVYGAGTSDNGIAVFSRNQTTGQLGFKQVVKEGDPTTNGHTVTGLIQPVRVVISPGGDWLFVASLNDNDSTTEDAVLAVFARDPVSGQLSFQTSVTSPDLARARAMAISRDDSTIYAVGEKADQTPTLVTFTFDAVSGGLTEKDVYTEGTGGVAGLAKALDVIVSPDDDCVYVSGSDDNAIAVFSRDVSTGMLTFVTAVKDGVNGVSDLQAPGHLLVTQDGGFLYATATNSNAVVEFARDPATGSLSFVESLVNNQPDMLGNMVTGLGGVYGITVSPGGSQIYTGSTSGSALTVFRRDSVSGRLAITQVLRDNQNGVDGLAWSIDLAVSPDGHSLYTAANMDNKIGVFGVSSADLNVVLTADADTVNAGQQVHYAIVATNNGPDSADNTMVTDALPVNLTYMSGTPSQGTCSYSGGTLICNTGTIFSGATAMVKLTATVASTTNSVTNTAQVGSDARDPHPSDNKDNLTLAVNTPPTAADDSAVTNIGKTVTVAVLANDQDSDGDALSVSAYDAASAQGGAIALNGDATLTYTPPSGYMGTDSFHYTVSDGHGGTASALVSVLVNTPPVAEDDSVTTTVDTPTTIYVLVNDHDANGDPFSVSAVTSPSQKGGNAQANTDGTVTYTPPTGFTGTDTFGYTITDSNGGSATATVTVQVQAATSTSSASGSTSTSSSEAGGTSGGGALSWQFLCAISLIVLVMRSMARRPRNV